MGSVPMPSCHGYWLSTIGFDHFEHLVTISAFLKEDLMEKLNLFD
jgi:hypothetical protein